MSYPGNLASDVVLRDGSTVSMRPVRPDDGPLLLEFFSSLDDRSLAFRFFTGAPNLEAVARALTEVDQRRRFGLLALRGAERVPVGHGFFAAIDDARVEIAFAVSPDLQGHGLGSVLLAHLAERAAEAGFAEMVAEVLPGNHAMISMFRDSGFPVAVRSEVEAVEVEMPTSPDPQSIARFQERDSLAARAAVTGLFEGGAEAVLDGAPEEVLARARELGAAGATAIVVRSPLTPSQSDELLGICRAAGTRLVGPASFGLLDNRSQPALDLTGSGAAPPPAGRIGVATQGAETSRELLAAIRRRGIGISSFVSLGDRVDLTANDLLEYWEADPATDVALLHVESFSDPRRFARVSRRIGGSMPIVVVAAGAAAASPGRGLFDQVGALRAADLDEALDLATSPPLGDRPGHRVAPPVVPAACADEAAAILAGALADEATDLDQDACERFLSCYGIELRPRPEDGPGGARLRVAIEADPLFGPVLRCAPPGEDVVGRPARICPLGEGDGDELIRIALGSSEGAPSEAARAALERSLEAIAAAAAAHAEIAALELDPLLAGDDGVAGAAAARITIRRPVERRPWPRTWE